MPPITIDPSTGKASVEINVKGNEGRVIGKGGETVKHIERKFAVKIEMRRERGTCVVTGAEAVMRDAAALISEVIERGDINKGERAVAGSIPGAGFGVAVETPGTMIAKLLASARAKIDSGEDASAADFPEVLRGDEVLARIGYLAAPRYEHANPHLLLVIRNFVGLLLSKTRCHACANE